MLNWVLFPSPAREASANAHRLCRADAVGLEGRGLHFSHPPRGLDPCPEHRPEPGFLSGSVPVCSHHRTNPCSRQDSHPCGGQGGTGSVPARCPGFGEQARFACRKRQALQGSLLAVLGCTEPFTLQHPSPKVTLQGWVNIKQAAQREPVS